MASEHSNKASVTPTIAEAIHAKPPTATMPVAPEAARALDAARLWLLDFFFGVLLPFGLCDLLADLDLVFLSFFDFFDFLFSAGVA